MMHSYSERKMMIIWSMCLIFSISNSILVFASPAKHLCLPNQRDALYEFKSEFYVQGIYSDDMPADKKTERWRNNTDCCYWDGVSCDLETGNVIELNLAVGSLSGPLRSNSSLFRLQHLQSLYLGSNNISGILPDSIGNLKYLRVLSLSGCSFFGKISSSLGNLSYLTDLSLSYNEFTGELPDSIGNLKRLIKLQLVQNKLSGNFPYVLLNMSELTTIELRSNQLEGTLPSNMSRLSKLEYFDIGSNSFSGSVSSSLFMIPSLIYLNLERNRFSGPLEIGNISSPSKLQYLSFGGNNLNGPIHGFISKLVGLSYLDLSLWNTGRGIVDFSTFLHLKSLRYLFLSYLNTRSTVDLSIFSNLMSLKYLYLSGNNLKISSTLHLPSTIKFLALSSCNISEFPKFLQTQTNLYQLDISANQIEGQVPEWLWRLPGLEVVDLSQNSFSGFEGPTDVIQTNAISMLDISANQIEGQVPEWLWRFPLLSSVNISHNYLSGLGDVNQRSGVLEMLDISFNTFQGPLPLLPKSMKYFFGSNNLFSGEIPMKLCELVTLDTLVLSNNNFSGSIPRCFENFRNTIWALHLQNNSLSGGLPEESIGDNLTSLDVGHNLLSGELPKSLINCMYLEFLNVEDNMFNDTFPFWLRLLPHLQILVLRSNEFHGPISFPGDSLGFPKLRVFDISENSFTGVLPSDYFAGWSAMSSLVDFEDSPLSRYARHVEYYHKSVVLTNKGLKMELVRSGFRMYKTIDVSGNRLKGDIPESISLLKGLIVLNMSNNVFTGRIPPSLSNLTNLQSLDLSKNRLSGKIPPELGELTFLSLMNFSYNRLEGPIPQGTQIQSQNSSSFAENPGLCGVPLQETCGGGDEATTQEEDEEKEEKDQLFNWIAAAIGYVPGVFCGVTIGHILTSYKHDWFTRIFHSSI